MHLYKWDPLIVIHYPTKIDGHRHCGTGDMMLLLAEGQDLT